MDTSSVGRAKETHAADAVREVGCETILPSVICEGGSSMPVLIRHRSAMTPAQYDEVSPPLVELIKTQPGFLLHVSYEDAGGFVVAEVWETQELHDAWFDANVKPNVPGEITQEVIDLHSVHKP
jgi:hypothetical protein